MKPATTNSTRYGKVLYQTAAWKRMRAHQLNKEPLCAYCARAGVVRAATVADHIIPHRGDTRLFYKPENLQSLCAPCHNSVKQREENGTLSQVGVDGMPADPSHAWNKEQQHMGTYAAKAIPRAVGNCYAATKQSSSSSSSASSPSLLRRVRGGGTSKIGRRQR